MKTLRYTITEVLMSLAFVGILLSCNGQPSEEMLARERALRKIYEAEKAIDEYLMLVEKNYKFLIDDRVKKLNEAVAEAGADLERHPRVAEVNNRIRELKEQRTQLSQKIMEMKTACHTGCDDFATKIDEIFKALDEHLYQIDSLLITI